MKILFSILLCLCGITAFSQALSVYDLSCEHKTNPIGIDVKVPRFSWKINGSARNTLQTSYSIRVATTPDFTKKSIVWESGKVNSDESILQEYKGQPLQPNQRYFWQVKVADNNLNESAWSNAAFFETAFLDKSLWKAKWIEPEKEVVRYSPASLVRKEFTLKKKIAQARIYVTSHGFYELHLNGAKVGDEVLTPYWTAYEKRLQYQTYDVTTLLASGKNAIGAMLGDGWYRGTLAWGNQWAIYGKNLGLLCQLQIKYTDGTEETIISDESWKATNEGPIRMNDIYNGETYDARKELIGWDKTGFDTSSWWNVSIGNYSNDNLMAQEGMPVKRIEELKPIKIWRTPKGTLVADLGQNMVGWIRLKVNGPAGTAVTIRHAEVMDKFGEFYTENLRAAKVTLNYTLKGGGEEVYEPRFTFMGFRYIAVEGFPGELKPENITGVVVHSEMTKTGSFECSNPLVNQLQHNIQWGQKGNFVDVPTDCPQRDERLGWTGDAQAFCRTAAYNYDVASFFTKWLGDLSAEQRPNGAVQFVIPDVISKKQAEAPVSAGWGDVATIAPWTLYQVYGDKRLLERQYPSMKAYVDYIRSKAGDSNLWKNGSVFGDWLFYKPEMAAHTEADGYTDKDMIATMFYAYSASLVAKAAAELGKTEDAQFYQNLFEKIKATFIEEYVTPKGRIASDSQTAYVLALHFNLLPDNLKTSATNYLVADIKGRKNHLSTGFLGTPYLCHVLSENGQTNVSYDLLTQETFPSWLYPIKMGATTIWERWDGQKTDSTFQDKGMNSFNHYAYGAIGDWMYRVVAGIEIGKVGYKQIKIQPHPNNKFDFAKANLESNYGPIASGWERKNGKMKFTVKIPANTTALITLPNTQIGNVTENGTAITAKSDFRNIKTDSQNVVFEVGSGSYVFEY